MARAKAPAKKKVVEADEEFDIDTSEAEIISAGVDLRSKVKELKLGRGEKDPVAAAEAALKRMETTFVVWIKDETDKLLDVWRAADAVRFAEPQRSELFRGAHDLKGQAATLGYPTAGRIAGSLCMLLDHAGPAERLPRELVRQHVQAIRAIVAEDAREEANPTAVKLADKLEDVTTEYLASLPVPA